MTTPEYEAMVESLKADFDEFNTNAEEGKEGRGSKGKALSARKMSMTISNKLKDFRSLSIANDKVK